MREDLYTAKASYEHRLTILQFNISSAKYTKHSIHCAVEHSMPTSAYGIQRIISESNHLSGFVLESRLADILKPFTTGQAGAWS